MVVVRTRPELVADCASCRALCCVGPAFVASADFALDKPAGRACPHLRGDDRCGIHDRLPERGFPGCVTFDCFGAGQRVIAARDRRDATAFAALDAVRALHEILWYLADARDHERAGPLRKEVDALAERVEEAATPDAAVAADVDAWRAEASPLLARVADLVRAPVGPDLARADLAGADLRRRDLVGASLRGALLLGADLRGADLARAELLGADLRGADLRGADLRSALFVTTPQLAAARLDGATRVPVWFTPPRPAAPVAVAAPAPPPPRRGRARR